MSGIHNLIRNNLLAKAGLLPAPPPAHNLKDLEKTEWVPLFEKLMRNRLIMGALRYGTLEKKRKIGHKWDLVGAVEEKVRLYKETGNTEYLVDIANYCMLEFECGMHPNKHFHALDNHHNHCKTKKDERPKVTE